jgi:hypothetical protein
LYIIEPNVGRANVPTLRMARAGGKKEKPEQQYASFRGICPRFAQGKQASIVLISESLPGCRPGLAVNVNLSTLRARQDMRLDEANPDHGLYHA